MHRKITLLFVPAVVLIAFFAKSSFKDSQATNEGMSLTHRWAGLPVDAMALRSREDVIVATVKSVSWHRPTNGNPPIVLLQVHNVLRGDKDIDRTRACWAPFPHDVDWSGGEADAMIARWSKRRMPLPKTDEKLILFGDSYVRQDKLTFWVSPVGRFPFSGQNLSLALQGIKKHAQATAKSKTVR